MVLPGKFTLKQPTPDPVEMECAGYWEKEDPKQLQSRRSHYLSRGANTSTMHFDILLNFGVVTCLLLGCCPLLGTQAHPIDPSTSQKYYGAPDPNTQPHPEARSEDKAEREYATETYQVAVGMALRELGPSHPTTKDIEDDYASQGGDPTALPALPAQLKTAKPAPPVTPPIP